MLFAKREIRKEPFSPGWDGPRRPCKFNLDYLSSWEGSSDRIMTRHHPRACWEFEPWKLRFGWFCSGTEPTS